MLKTILAFVPLLAGYIFVTTWNETRYLIRREQSQQVYFRAAFWGIWLFALALGCTHVLLRICPDIFGWLDSWANRTLPLDSGERNKPIAYWLIALSITIGIGSLGGFLLNWCQAIKTINGEALLLVLGRRVFDKQPILPALYGYSTKQPLRRAIARLNADFERILLRALDLSMPVCISLNHGKVYVGYMAGAVDPVDSRDMIRILPYMSGYRESDTLRVRYTTFYVELYKRLEEPTLEHLHPEQFEIAFPFADIQSVNLFDIDAYIAFQEIRSPAANQTELPKPLSAKGPSRKDR